MDTSIWNGEAPQVLVADENGIYLKENKTLESDSGEQSQQAAPTAEDNTPKPTVEDIAAHDFTMLLPKFWEQVEGLSMRAQGRVFRALMEYPLAENFPNLPFESEKKAFYTGLQILDCKFILQTAVLNLTKNKEKLDQFKKELAEAKQATGVATGEKNDLQG